LRRKPFAPADVDAVVAFCAAHGRIRDVSLLRSLLLDLTSDPTGVIVLEDGGDVALVAAAVDRVSNGADAANLETLGVRVAPAAATFMQLVVEPALAFARAGERRALQVALPPSLTAAGGFDEVLRAAGFGHAYDSFEMLRPASAPPPGSPEALPPGWSWVDLDAARADAAHAALLEIFRGAPSTSAKPLADFRQAVATGAIWRALLDGDRIAGLVRIASDGARGQVRVLGRVPAYRGQGIGPRLLAEALRLLGTRGVGDVNLDVEAANERALDLYRRFAFEVVERTPVFARALRG